MNSESTISAARVFKIILFSLLIAVSGIFLVFLGIEWGRYLVYVSVSVGAVATIVGTLLAMAGKLNKDL